MLGRNKRGQFVKGFCSSPETQFKKGEHWRSKKVYWDKDWLIKQYIGFCKPANQIANEQSCTGANILYFLKKYQIPTRSTKEIRKAKYWGLPGKKNGMYGRTGRSNPNWNGGHSPERQSKYARSMWKELAKKVRKRDNQRCQNCGSLHGKSNRLVVHHVKEWSKFPKLRFKLNNLITLCEKCHKGTHMKRDRIIQGDSLEVLKGLPSKTVSVVITSPPYW